MYVLMARLTSLSNIHGALFGSVLLPAASSTSCNQKASKQRFQQPSPAVNLLERERATERQRDRDRERELHYFFIFLFFLGGLRHYPRQAVPPLWFAKLLRLC